MSEVCQLTSRRARADMDALLLRAGLRMEAPPEMAFGVYEGDALAACGGCTGRVLRYLATDPACEGEGLISKIVTALYAQLRAAGHESVFLFTKPENERVFASLGFYTLAATRLSLLMESRADGVSRWADGLSGRIAPLDGVLVLHANPFTRGHRFLAECASRECERLGVFVLEGGTGRLLADGTGDFPFADRFALVSKGLSDIPNAQVFPGGPYLISQSSFPGYYLKRASDAAAACAALDAALFAARVAPALGTKTRFVGSEPLDAMTACYNEALASALPPSGVALRVLERKTDAAGLPISASRVRAFWQAGALDLLRPLVPDTSYAYLAAHPYPAKTGGARP